MTASLKSKGARFPVRKPRPSDAPDLQSQLEAIFDSVWDAEANWRLDDRIDLALHLPRRREG